MSERQTWCAHCPGEGQHKLSCPATKGRVTLSVIAVAPAYPPALVARFGKAIPTVLAVPPGQRWTETAAPEQGPATGVTLTANPLRLWQLTEAEAAWFVKNGEWTPFPCPPCVLTLGEIAAIAWGIKALFADEIHRFGSLCSWTARNDEEEAEVHALDVMLRERGIHPGWPIMPRAMAGDRIERY